MSGKVTPITLQPAPRKLFGQDLSEDNTVKWVDQPIGGTAAIPGLEYLLGVDRLFFCNDQTIVKEHNSSESTNFYERGILVKDKECRLLYRAVEELHGSTDCCGKECRGFTMHLFDRQNNEILRATKEYKPCVCCPCLINCAHDICLETPTGEVIGYVLQRCGGGFKVQDRDRNTILRIDYTDTCCICCEGDGCKTYWENCCSGCKCDGNNECCSGCKCDGNNECCSGCKDCCDCEDCCSMRLHNQIYTLTNKNIGFFTNKWPKRRQQPVMKDDCVCELLFWIQFPGDLEVSAKGTLMAAGFLLDVLFYESERSCCK